MKIKKYKNNKGFTLVEALFAIFILTFTITGLMVIVADSLFSARYAKDEITANYLLQEAVDYIRNDRDTIVFLRNGSEAQEDETDMYWNNFINKYNSCISQDGCYLNVSEKEIERCNDSGTGNDNKCPFLYYNDKNTSENYFYAGFESDDIIPTGFVKTNFQRKVFFKKDDDNDGVIVTVTLNWKNGGVPIERTLSTVLMYWNK